MIVTGLYSLGYAVPTAITIFGSDNYWPISWLDENQQAKGLAIDAAEFVQKDTGIKITIELVPWNRAFKMAQHGSGGIVGLSKTSEREAIFDYSKVFHDSGVYLVVNKNRPLQVKSIDDLQGKKIGALIGVSYGPAIDLAIKKGQFQAIRDVSNTARLKNLLHGRIDGAFMANVDTELPRYLAADPELAANANAFVVLKNQLAEDPVFVAFRKGGLDDATRDKLFQSFEKWSKLRESRKASK
ncbi:transporter substrate-binding domain-containing protein [Chitinibacter sp. SCUT-21]|uniref:substrate-binding periplasmic protein n=1 Tax=Chitinibacter sp. SCUT-21 TaxID=2970891 RepID=UPI0035A619FF